MATPVLALNIARPAGAAQADKASVVARMSSGRLHALNRLTGPIVVMVYPLCLSAWLPPWPSVAPPCGVGCLFTVM
jgi:hypothetical protein